MRICIFGIPGSGKTSFARSISPSLGIPVFHIDKHFFEKGWIERNHDLFLEDVRSVLQNKDWIIDGNGMRTLEMRYREADIVIYFRFPRLLCLYRIFFRWFSLRGLPKEDGPEGSSNSVSRKLVTYLWNFQKKYGATIQDLQKRYPGVRFFEVRSEQDRKSMQEVIASFAERKGNKKL